MSSPDNSLGEKGQVFQGTALRRKMVRLFDQGSILNWPEDGVVRGHLADVTPAVFEGTHKVWRYGLTWAVGYAARGEGA
jgi:hypothetical protein